MIEKIRIRGYRKYVDATIFPNTGLNIIVGGNDSGKSTLLDAITLALTGRVNGRSAQEEVNPHWFNQSVVQEFFDDRAKGRSPSPPVIHIELFLQDSDDVQTLKGAINSATPTHACPGLAIDVEPNPEYAVEIEKYFALTETSLLPVEFYKVNWRSFADNQMTMRPKAIRAALIDSQTVRSSSGIDYYLRQILSDHLEPSDKAEISVAFRQAKQAMSVGALKSVNEKVAAINESLHDGVIGLAMDQTSRTSWDASITPQVDDIPFAMTGQGQQASIKIALAMNRNADNTNIVMIEEPENHLSHTSLNKLVDRIQNLSGDSQQLFITTHSSFVLNRLGLDALVMVEGDNISRFGDLDEDTVNYFRKLPGYDTLRIVLAEKLVLVEGPSDEIVFERFYRDIYGKRPIEDGIDVLSMRGLSLDRCLQLSTALGRKTAAMRDNDGKNPQELIDAVRGWLDGDRRRLFIGAVSDGKTLEPQILKVNDPTVLRRVLGRTERADLLIWMTNNKTEAAIKIAGSPATVKAPAYMREAAQFIHEA